MSFDVWVWILSKLKQPSVKKEIKWKMKKKNANTKPKISEEICYFLIGEIEINLM